MPINSTTNDFTADRGTHFIIISLVLGIICSVFLSMLVPHSPKRSEPIRTETRAIRKGPFVVESVPLYTHKATRPEIIASLKNFGKAVKIPGIILGGHLIITLLTYCLAFKEDIKEINKSKFSRTKKAVIAFVIASTVLVIMTPVITFVSLPAVLSLGTITLSVFVSIMISRSGVNEKAWGRDTFLILVATVYLFFLAYVSFWLIILMLLAAAS